MDVNYSVDRNVNDVKEEMVESISDIFLKYGLRSTSMDDICSHLKISKKTLYQYFHNKDEIVEKVMDFRAKSNFRKGEHNELYALNAVHIFLTMKLFMLEEFNALLPANIYDMKKYHPNVFERFEKEREDFLNYFLNTIIDKGINEGLLRSDINRDLQIYLFSKQTNFLTYHDMNITEKFQINNIISTIVDNFVRSLITDKGREEFEKFDRDKILKIFRK